MDRNIGWAEPEVVIGEPRIQMVEGFHYFYIEQIHPGEGGKEILLDVMIEQARALYRQSVEDTQPLLLVMFFDVDNQPNVSDIQVGFVVPAHVQARGEAKVRFVPPSLVASMIAWGDVNSLAMCYGPLLAFIREKGYEAVVGWREYYLYWEGEASRNNITWVQHLIRLA